MSEFIDENVKLDLEINTGSNASASDNGNVIPEIARVSLPSAMSPSSLSSTSRSPSNRGKKKVTFAPSTLVKEEDTIASSVTSHQYVAAIGHTQYKVELIFRGVHWTIVKRYRDFETFHRKLIHGLPDEEMSVVPELPKKRWFEKQRWINRFDDTYSRNRRFQLQDYLRMVIRTFPFQENQGAFVEFLEIPSEALDQEDRNSVNEYAAQKERDIQLEANIKSETDSQPAEDTKRTVQNNYTNIRSSIEDRRSSEEDVELSNNDSSSSSNNQWQDDDGDTDVSPLMKKIMLSAEEADSDDEED